MRTFSLEESTVQLCGGDNDGNPLPHKVQWLAKQLRAGKLPGYKAGREWRLTEDDIAAAIESLRPTRIAVPDVPGLSGLTRTSRRRLAS